MSQAKTAAVGMGHPHCTLNVKASWGMEFRGRVGCLEAHAFHSYPEVASFLYPCLTTETWVLEVTVGKKNRLRAKC